MDVRNLTGKLALITGAATGIGRETSLALARAGADLAICDLNEADLERTAADCRALGREVLTRRVDVARSETMQALADAVHRQRAAVDVLVNNAGVGLGATFLETSLEDWEWIVGINLWGVIYGCHLFIPPMVARGQGGHVVNVASAAGIAAAPQLSAYCTTKFGVVGLSEALREELRPHGIGVTTVCPGIINTPIVQTSRLRGLSAAPGARERLAAVYARRNYGPERVARLILKAIARNRAIAPITPEAWAIYLLKRLSPRMAAWVGRVNGARLERQLRGGSGTVRA